MNSNCYNLKLILPPKDDINTYVFLDEARDVKMSVGVSGNVPRLGITNILNDKLHLEYFREFLNFKDQRLITLHRGTVQTWHESHPSNADS